MDPFIRFMTSLIETKNQSTFYGHIYKRAVIPTDISAGANVPLSCSFITVVGECRWDLKQYIFNGFLDS